MGSKNNKLFRALTLLTAMLLIVFMIGTSTFADVGNSASHKSGSRSRSYSSGSSRSGYSSGGGFFFFPSMFGSEGVAVVVVIIVVGFYIYRRRSRYKGGSGGSPLDAIGDLLNGGNHRYDDQSYDRPDPMADTFNSEAALLAIKQSDPNFSRTAFESKVQNMYIQLQEAWMKKNWRLARVFETDELFNVHAKQLQHFIDSHTTNKVDNIAILKTEFTKYVDDGVNDVAYVLIKARINDYTINDNTSKVISGNPNVDIYMTYMWKLIRRKGVVTKVDDKTAKVSQCPNCGANVSINASGECEYCGSTVSNGQYDWVLASIEVMDQQNDY